MHIFGAGNETRTRDLNLGKVALYQLSYSRTEKTALRNVVVTTSAGYHPLCNGSLIAQKPPC